MNISLKELAKVCKLSVSTVSKALNGYDDVNPDTKAFVLKTARELGYFPNASARALKTGRTLNLGVLFVDDNESGLTHTYFAEVLDSFKVEAEKRGYDITFINHNIGSNTMTYLEHCRYRNVDGICVACADFNNPEVKELARADIPMVAIDHIYEECSCVLSENSAGVRMLMHHVYTMGHRKIAFIHGTDSHVTRMRIEGYRMMLESFGLPYRPEYVAECTYQAPAEAQKAAEKMLQLDDPPTCILMPDDFSALGGLEAVRNAGLNVPEDVSLAGYDGSRLLQRFRPKLTTLQQDTLRLGQEAARLLIQEIEGGEKGARIIVNGRLIPGETVAAPKRA